MARVQLKGFRELAGALDRLAVEAPDVIAPALTRSLGPMAARSRAEAPRVTGTLADAIELRQVNPVAGVCRSEVVVPLEYGVHRDLGTRRKAADRFLQRAADATEERAVVLAADDITAGVEAVLKQG